MCLLQSPSHFLCSLLLTRAPNLTFVILEWIGHCVVHTNMQMAPENGEMASQQFLWPPLWPARGLSLETLSGW